MANVYKNIRVLGLNGSGLQGSLSGQFVNRKTGLEKALIARNPPFDDNRKHTEIQKTDPTAVREAATYANFARTQEVYINKAKKTAVTPYYLAVADWFESPRVLEINVDHWEGEIGQTIRVKARDNVMVARISVVIRDADEKVLERGEAVQSEADNAWWEYFTQAHVAMTPFPIVEAIAQDLPGNIDSFIIS